MIAGQPELCPNPVWTQFSHPARIWMARILHKSFGISLSLLYRLSSLTNLVNAKAMNQSLRKIGASQHLGILNEHDHRRGNARRKQTRRSAVGKTGHRCLTNFEPAGQRKPTAHSLL